jgi:hypothetical protein
VRRCDWCSGPINSGARKDARFDKDSCRKAAFRIKRRYGIEGRSIEERSLFDRPMRFAYADPPYPGLARYYRREKDFAGEVDHARLLEVLQTSGFDGWALSTSADALREILPLCPRAIKVLPWVKPIGVDRRGYGLHRTWEPLFVVPGRALRPGFRDFLSAHPARSGGKLWGRKPLAFCGFLFRALGMLPGDELVDFFPGSRIVGRAWREISANVRRSDDSRGDVEYRLEAFGGFPAEVIGPRLERVGGVYTFRACCGSQPNAPHFAACNGQGLDPSCVEKKRLSSTRDGSGVS